MDVPPRYKNVGNGMEEALKPAQSWKAPGNDGICTFFRVEGIPQSCHCTKEVKKPAGRIVNQEEDIPDWLMKGRTVLIMKEG